MKESELMALVRDLRVNIEGFIPGLYLFYRNTSEDDWRKAGEARQEQIEKAHQLIQYLDKVTRDFMEIDNTLFQNQKSYIKANFQRIHEWLIDKSDVVIYHITKFHIFNENPFGIIVLDRPEDTRKWHYLYASFQALVADVYYRVGYLNQLVEEKLEEIPTVQSSPLKKITEIASDSRELNYYYYQYGRESSLRIPASFFDNENTIQLSSEQFGSFILGVYHFLNQYQPDYAEISRLCASQSSHQLLLIFKAVHKLAPHHLDLTESLYPYPQDPSIQALNRTLANTKDYPALSLLLPSYRCEAMISILEKQIKIEQEFSDFFNEETRKSLSDMPKKIYNSPTETIRTSILTIKEINQQLLKMRNLLDINLLPTNELHSIYINFLSYEELLYETLTISAGLNFQELEFSTVISPLEQNDGLLQGSYQPLLFESYYLLRSLCISLSSMLKKPAFTRHQHSENLKQSSREKDCIYYCLGRDLDLSGLAPSKIESSYSAYLSGLYFALYLYDETLPVPPQYPETGKAELMQAVNDIRKTLLYRFAAQSLNQTELKPYIPVNPFEQTLKLRKSINTLLSLAAVREVGIYALPRRQSERTSSPPVETSANLSL
ncbi:hypothetical protein [Legionella sp. 16cNR16C]|uniref:hypothetical protein n=1 Tax=Legionella sp. 16cNR16C TaxID=2905656 RepID=UPI001E4B8E7A|nr:hypothetical protein [Legionella sp. 16cNR16C]MCE3044699.1 hypothetical protein [Legionella sp. 16cNR16C]